MPTPPKTPITESSSQQTPGNTSSESKLKRAKSVEAREKIKKICDSEGKGSKGKGNIAAMVCQPGKSPKISGVNLPKTAAESMRRNKKIQFTSPGKIIPKLSANPQQNGCFQGQNGTPYKSMASFSYLTYSGEKNGTVLVEATPPDKKSPNLLPAYIDQSASQNTGFIQLSDDFKDFINSREQKTHYAFTVTKKTIEENSGTRRPSSQKKAFGNYKASDVFEMLGVRFSDKIEKIRDDAKPESLEDIDALANRIHEEISMDDFGSQSPENYADTDGYSLADRLPVYDSYPEDFNDEKEQSQQETTTSLNKRETHLFHFKGHGFGGDQHKNNLTPSTAGANYALLIYIELVINFLIMKLGVEAVDVKVEVEPHLELDWLPESITYTITWGKGLSFQATVYPLCTRKPSYSEYLVAKEVVKALTNNHSLASQNSSSSSETSTTSETIDTSSPLSNKRNRVQWQSEDKEPLTESSNSLPENQGAKTKQNPYQNIFDSWRDDEVVNTTPPTFFNPNASQNKTKKVRFDDEKQNKENWGISNRHRHRS